MRYKKQKMKLGVGLTYAQFSFFVFRNYGWFTGITWVK